MTTPPIPPRTLVDLFDQFRLEYFPDKTPGTRYVYQCFFLRTLAQLGNVPLAAVTPDLLRTWKTGIRERTDKKRREGKTMATHRGKEALLQ